MQNAQPPLDDDDVGQPESPRQVLVPVPPQPPLDDDDVGQPESPRQVLVPVPPQPPLDDDDVGQPESPRQVLLPIPHQQELARRRIAYALVTILGFEVLAALLLLLCVIEPLVIPIENLRTIMTI